MTFSNIWIHTPPLTFIETLFADHICKDESGSVHISYWGAPYVTQIATSSAMHSGYKASHEGTIRSILSLRNELHLTAAEGAERKLITARSTVNEYALLRAFNLAAKLLTPCRLQHHSRVRMQVGKSLNLFWSVIYKKINRILEDLISSCLQHSFKSYFRTPKRLVCTSGSNNIPSGARDLRKKVSSCYQEWHSTSLYKHIIV